MLWPTSEFSKSSPVNHTIDSALRMCIEYHVGCASLTTHFHRLCTNKFGHCDYSTIHTYFACQKVADKIFVES